ncbi:MAG: TolC family protein [Candidatus Omnitrophica bacterium]|nr:TolC family protein [Candidatus Omnitrophota bacterium]MDD5042813.1 TolC family protein [Candidatus Omnitrophota bacterium]
MNLLVRTTAFLLVCGFFSAQAYAQEELNWQGCIAEARKNNPQLISAVESVNQQAAGKDITASALYPQVSASAGVSTAKVTSTNADTGVRTDKTNDSYNYGVSGTQLLFDGLKTVNDVKSASEEVRAAREAYRFTSSEVRLSLRGAFVNLLQAQELIHVAEEISKIRRENLELITLRYQSGLEHRGALLTAEADVAEANFEVAQAKRDLDYAQRRLSKEMGRGSFSPLYAKGGFDVADSAREKPDFELIVENNPSLLQAAAKKNAASFDIKSAYADFAPQILGSLSADKSGSNWPPRDKNLSAGLSVSIPIFEGGMRLAQLAQSKSAYRQAEADEKNVRDSALVSLEQAWALLQDGIETVDVQRKALDAAVERSTIAEAQYSTGFITFDNWTIIEDNLVKAKKSFLNAQANALLAEANWVYAKGETLEYAQ